MNDLIENLEQELRDYQDAVTDPKLRECLCCYVNRMLELGGCDNTLRWAKRYRDLRVPTAVALERRLGDIGGFCDCELFLNGYDLHERLYIVPPEVVVDEYGSIEQEDPHWPEPLPECSGVRAGSARPCDNWVRLRRR
jgi:hypothetical protein